MKKMIVSMVMLATIALAPAVSNAETASITSGVMNMSYTPITFAPVQLNSTVNQTINGTSNISVTDDRGTGGGWAIKLSVTEFISDSIADLSSGGTGQMVVKLPANSLIVTLSNKTLVSGQGIDAINGPLIPSLPLTMTTGSNPMLMAASPGFGMGSYKADAVFSVTVPKTVEVVSFTGSGSKYTVGAAIGTIATTYRSTFTFSTVVGI